jgi:HlyD family secretion protein
VSQEVQTTAPRTLPAERPAAVTAPVIVPTPSLRSELRGPARLGVVILAAFFVVGGGWAATAPISGAAIASGVVSPDGSRQRIQHLEGGIIREIRVRDGDRVQTGDVLMVLADVSRQSEVGQLATRLQALAATEARLQAERRSAPQIAFDHPALADRTDPEVRKVTEQQVNQFVTRKANDASQEAILTQRIAQLKQQIVGAEKQLASVRRQGWLISEELVVVKEMYEKGYEKKSRLLSLQRTEADLQGQEGELLSRIARAEEQIGETNLQIINIGIKRKEDIDQQLAETQGRRIETEQQIKDSLDKLARTSIVAPVSGTVLDLRFKTTGGVVRPGEEVLDIIPNDDKLIIDARISPNDADDVHAGQHAYVIFPSFPQRNLRRIDAQVRTVSADAFEDERTGERYFTAKIEVDRQQLHKLDPPVQLTPGMPADAFIATVDRTLLEYLIQPLLFTVEHSFREQ